MLLKFITFLIICYLVYRILGGFFRILLLSLGSRGGFGRYQQQQRQKQHYQRPVGSIKVDYVPEEHQKRSDGKHHDSNDGEYVDYEEVK